MNTSPFNTNVRESHTAHACRRTVGEKNSELFRAKYNPHAITAITPEACAASAARYTTYGTMMLTVISIGPSSSRRSNHSTTNPITNPTAIPARIKYPSRKNPCPTVGRSPVTTIPTANASATSPVASFTKLSPSSMSAIRFGNPSRRAIAVAAIASVVESTAPSTNPNLQSNPLNTHGAAYATPTAVNATSPTASIKMVTKFSRKSLHDVSQAPL